ncbi:MAG: hypothetical protein J6Q15_00050, partial [Clostridia bacterium]|nr:hypothetical protein [Clostridia bacterium]
SKNNGNFIHNSYATYYAMNIVNSLASVSISSALEAGGLVGYLQGFGTIYNAYYYGVINPSVTINPITKAINGEAENIAYNNVYSIVNGIEKVNQIYTNNVDGSITINANIIDFNISSEYNNGKPYLVYIDGTNLVSIIPTIIQVNQAFKDTYYYDNNINLYRINSEFGDYVRIEGNMVKYEPGVHQGRTRYSLIASRVDTFDPSGNDSDYRTHALVLYYYQFKDMTGENALTDLYYLNTIDMHKIINDDGIIVLPNTIKRFNLKSSNNDIVTVLNGGKLLLRSEGQVTITLISALNPSVTASFVVIVRTKVQEFGLYSNANLRDEYNVSNKTISIVKDSSKLLYANYSSIIKVYGRQYEYVPATNMKIKFTISYNGATLDGNIKDYVILNGAENGGEYFISYGVPITVSVLNYAEETFTIRAIPYIVVNYINGEYNWTEEIELNHYMVHFNIATKKGATAINTDHTQLDMMPADEKASVSAKINTDMEVDKLIIEISSVGSEFEIDNINKHYTGTESDTIAFVEM